ncbi:metal cation-transporting ATPase, partial [Polyporus arcularius HHB13444]
MAVIFRRPGADAEKAPWVALMKGAVERVLDACMQIQSSDGVRPIKASDQDEIMQHVDQMAGSGLRVLALAGREWAGDAEGVDRAEVERDMMFYGVRVVARPGAYRPLAASPRGRTRQSKQEGALDG